MKTGKFAVACSLAMLTAIATAQSYSDQNRMREERDRQNEEQRRRDAQRDHDAIVDQIKKDRERDRPSDQTRGVDSNSNIGALILGTIVIGTILEAMSNPSGRRPQPYKPPQIAAWERDRISRACFYQTQKGFTRSNASATRLQSLCMCVADAARANLSPSELSLLEAGYWPKVQTRRLAAVATPCADSAAEQADLERLIDETMPPVESVAAFSDVSLYVTNTCKSTVVLHALDSSRKKIRGLALDPGRRMPFFAMSKPDSDGTFLMAWRLASSGQGSLQQFDPEYSTQPEDATTKQFYSEARRVKPQQPSQDAFEVALACR